ncbi:MAG: hypothetical protein AAFY60_09455, partial [Myxococcota bacterium]
AFLIGRGIDAERIASKGYGEASPIESNATSEGRANNRRVEFVILDADGEVQTRDSGATLNDEVGE